MRIPQTYHNISLFSSSVNECYIINSPLDVNEMYNFTKKRLNNVIANEKVRFCDDIIEEPGCPDVISLNTYANKLSIINKGFSPFITINKFLAIAIDKYL